MAETPNTRDRDEFGRPKNARPRDTLGRLLPRDAARTDHQPDAPALPPDAALAKAQELLDADRPFEAHEVLEAVWKSAPEAERRLWQGLAQVAVALTHVLRGNDKGARAVLERGRERLAEYAQQPPHEIDIAGLLDWCDELHGRLLLHGDTPQRNVPPPRLSRS